jgi:AcrR family transcriptional regulator
MFSKRAAGARKAAPAEPLLPTREVILDAAEALLAEHGVDGVAVRDLARELKLTPSSLYNHFAGKRALYERCSSAGSIRSPSSLPIDPGIVTPDGVRRTVTVIVDHLAAHPYLARLIQRALIEETEACRR